MVRTQRERVLFSIVLVSFLGLGGYMSTRWVYTAWADMNDEIQRQQLHLSKLQVASQRKAVTEQNYEDTQSQLTMNMHESAQKIQFNKELDALLRGAGMTYQEIKPQDRPRLEEDFKVLLIDVTQARGTPQQLGAFLYGLERQSNVMDVEELNITNEGVGRLRLGGARPGGVLTMDMQVARLVEYATGEKPEMSHGRLRPRGR